MDVRTLSAIRAAIEPLASLVGPRQVAPRTIRSTDVGAVTHHVEREARRVLSGAKHILYSRVVSVPLFGGPPALGYLYRVEGGGENGRMDLILAKDRDVRAFCLLFDPGSFPAVISLHRLAGHSVRTFDYAWLGALWVGDQARIHQNEVRRSVPRLRGGGGSFRSVRVSPVKATQGEPAFVVSSGIALAVAAWQGGAQYVQAQFGGVRDVDLGGFTHLTDV